MNSQAATTGSWIEVGWPASSRSEMIPSRIWWMPNSTGRAAKGRSRGSRTIGRVRVPSVVMAAPEVRLAVALKHMGTPRIDEPVLDRELVQPPEPYPALDRSGRPVGPTDTPGRHTGALGLSAVQAPPEFNLAQQQVVALLGASGSERPSFDADLATELRLELERGLAPVVAVAARRRAPVRQQARAVPGPRLRGPLPGRARRDFAWSVPLARGTLAHRAIEVGVSWSGRADAGRPGGRDDGPGHQRHRQPGRLAAHLRRLRPGRPPEPGHRARDHLLRVLPAAQAPWRPVLEGPLRTELLDGRRDLSGKPDLTIGHAQGTTAGKVIVDFKTGIFSPAHVADLRFYALLDTLRIGMPPRLLATYYLESGRPCPRTSPWPAEDHLWPARSTASSMQRTTRDPHRGGAGRPREADRSALPLVRAAPRLRRGPPPTSRPSTRSRSTPSSRHRPPARIVAPGSSIGGGAEE